MHWQPLLVVMIAFSRPANTMNQLQCLQLFKYYFVANRTCKSYNLFCQEGFVGSVWGPWVDGPF